MLADLTANELDLTLYLVMEIDKLCRILEPIFFVQRLILL